MEVELKRLQQEVTQQVRVTLTPHLLYMHTTHTHTHTTSSPIHLLLPLLSEYFVYAALLGFNQLDSDLAH